MSKLTAKEARNLAGPTTVEKVDSILEAIREEATNGKRELKTGWTYKEDEDLWIHGGYKGTADWHQAVKILEELGYVVTFYYEERQFVNMYTLIKW